MSKYKDFGGLNLPSIEKEILAKWEAEQAFEKSIELREGATPFVFYEGPPSANGMPGIHHVISRTLKDLVCRYKTMQGFQVKRKGGWDTHGLPIELGVEKELGITKEDIGTKISVEDYNKKCREAVLRYKNEWDNITKKMGYWVDLKNPYITYENNYIESLWWILKQLFNKGLLYESVSIQPYSPAAGTGLSSHELNQPGTYKDVKDTSATVMFSLPNPTKGGANESHKTVAKIFDAINNSSSKISTSSPLSFGEGWGEAATFFLAWTTTPWTLPSNLGLTVGPNIDYVLVKTFSPINHQPINVILAKALLHKYFKEENKCEIIEQFLNKTESESAEGSQIPPLGGGGAWIILAEFKGLELEGIEYEQLLPFSANSIETIQQQTPNAKPFRVLCADFVTTEDGTGIVHTAPAFGADDFKVGKKYDIGILTMVDKRGKFLQGIQDGVFLYGEEYVKEAYLTDAEKEVEFAKQKQILEANGKVKDLRKYLSVDDRIVLKLQEEGKLFKKEKYDHNYPHCWRTDKPILYYPLDAWFIKTTALKDRMVELNKTINWKPKSTGEGRFGNWLENMVDWNLSRSRYWGTPLPVWKTEDGEEQICIGSVDELISEIEKNITAINPEKIELFNQRKNIYFGLKSLKNALINPSEISNGIYRNDVGNIGLYFGKIGDTENKYKGGYGLSHIIAKRYSEGVDGYTIALKLLETIVTGTITKEVEQKQTIHIVKESIEAVLSKDKFGEEEIWLLTGWQINKPDVSGEFSPTTTATHFTPTFSRDEVGAGLSDAKIRENISNNLLFDLHKPFVDDIILVSPSGKPMQRVSDLIDVWFDSGAMPYAQHHFPFENKELFANSYPADFIAEGVDQTRGWFYTLHAIGSLIKESIEEELKDIKPSLQSSTFPPPVGGDRGGLAYKTVVSNGLVLDKNGNKMSKRLGNVVNPFETIEKYGADATRWYLITNASPWDNLKFDIAGIQEVQRKFFGTLYNTYQFFALYANVDGFAFKEEYIAVQNRPEIDRWILSSLNTLIKKCSEAMDDYEPTQAGRLIEEFVDEHLSNWYVRLCRRRFWKGEYEQDKIAAYQTLYECLETICRLIAPISPFFSDAVFQNLNAITNRFNAASVHHIQFPKANESVIESLLEERMQLAQDTCSLVLSLRKKVNIKVRQPLQKIMIPVLNPEMKLQLEKVEDLIKSEVNVKELQYLSETEGIIKKKAKANFKVLGAKLGANMKEAANQITNFNQHQIAELEQKGTLNLKLSTLNFDLSLEDVEIIAEDIPGWSVASKSALTVALDIVITPILKSEGDARELINRIQNIRKEQNFDLTDRIFVKIEQKDGIDSIKNSVNEHKTYICGEILAENIEWISSTIDNSFEVDVNDLMLKIAITKKG